jgi:hypothetical protein
MFDWSVHPKNLVGVFEYLSVLDMKRPQEH